MINLKEIRETIEELEDRDNSFQNCERLAALYTIIDHHVNNNSPVIQEYSDILPSYQLYCKVKTKYELKELNEEAVSVAMKTLCKEIKEFLQVLYSNTEMEQERIELRSMLKSLTF